MFLATEGKQQKNRFCSGCRLYNPNSLLKCAASRTFGSVFFFFLFLQCLVVVSQNLPQQHTYYSNPPHKSNTMFRSFSLGFLKRSGTGNSASSSTGNSTSNSTGTSRTSTATTKSSLNSSTNSNGKTKQNKRHSLASVKHEFANIVSRRPLRRHPSLSHSLSRLTSSQSCPLASKPSDNNSDSDDVLNGANINNGKSCCSSNSDASPKTITRADITTGNYQPPRVKKSRCASCQEACPFSSRKLPSSSTFSISRSKSIPAKRAAAAAAAAVSSGPTATSGNYPQPLEHTVRPYYNDNSIYNNNRNINTIYQDYSLQRLNSSHSAYTVATADPARVNFRVVVDTDISIGVVH